MLARYQIVRGKRPPGDPLPEGKRYDTRKHTHHLLRPEAAWVSELLDDVTPAAFKRFAARYLEALEQRFKRDRTPFDALAEEARAGDVYLGCSCPTAKNPDVKHCHTVLALRFMKKHYPKLDVVLPD
jgi:hypothetical protein